MRELDYIVLELEGWNKKTCDFYSNPFGDDNRAICQIRTHSKLTDELVANDVACEECRDRLNELPKCSNCGRFFTKADRDILSHKYVCDCDGKSKRKNYQFYLMSKDQMLFMNGKSILYKKKNNN